MIRMTEYLERVERIETLKRKTYAIDELLQKLDAAANDETITFEEFIVAKSNFSVSLITLMEAIIREYEIITDMEEN